MALFSINLFTAAAVNTSTYIQELAKIAYEIVSSLPSFQYVLK